MKHHIFTKEEREGLENNPNISKVLNSNVEYTEEFKQKVLSEHKELGKSAKQIFSEAGIPEWFNSGKYASKCLDRWKYQQRHRKINKRALSKVKGNKPLQEMSNQELIKEIQLLRLENEFLKKLAPLEQ